nr:translation initiation factor IF-2-like [Equus asinus]
MATGDTNEGKVWTESAMTEDMSQRLYMRARGPWGPEPQRFHASGSREPGRRRGEALPGAASPPTHPAGSGDSPPPETAGKLGQECQPGHSPPPRRPPVGRPLESARRAATCPAPSLPGGAGPADARRRRRLRGLGALGRAGRGTRSGGRRRRRRHGRLCACAASRARTRGAPQAVRGNGRGASSRLRPAHARPAVRMAARLGALRGTAARTADGHVSVPFFFFFSPSFRPFPQRSTFLPPSLSLSYCGGGWKRAWGRGGEGRTRGRGSARAPPPGGPQPRGPRSPPPPPAATPAGRGVPALPACEPRADAELGRRGPGRCFAPLPVGLGLEGGAALLPWPRAGGRCSSGFFKDGESDAESLKVTEESAERDTGLSGREVSFLGWELEFPRITGGLRRETCCLALPEVPSRLQRPGSLPRPRCRDGNSQGGNRLFPRSVLSCLLISAKVPGPYLVFIQNAWNSLFLMNERTARQHLLNHLFMRAE